LRHATPLAAYKHSHARPGYWELTVETTGTPETWGFYITNPNGDGVYVDWGDSSNDTYTGGGGRVVREHSYASPGTYKVRISGRSTVLDLSHATYAPMVKATGVVDGIVGINSIYSMFRGCINITSIPNDLFWYLPSTGISNTGYVFSGAGITSIPPDLFKYNMQDSNYIGYMFQSCTGITSVPSGLFDGFDSTVTTAIYAFSGCSNLTTIPSGLLDTLTGLGVAYNMFAYSGITSIPYGLFDNCPLTSINAIFTTCTALTSIPDGLFAGKTTITSGQYPFKTCYNLITLGSGVFSGCTGMTNITQHFYGCSNIITLPPDTYSGLDGSLTNVTQAFYNCNKITSASIPFWDWTTPPTTTSNCYQFCTSMSDYATIPAGYK